MPVFSTDALVLRTYRYGEADRIVVFLTADRGKKRGVAKNASRSRRRFGAALEPLTRGTASYVERETRELVRLDRVEPRSTPLQATAGRSAADGAHVLGHAAYFAELLDEWAPENAPNERLFRLGAAIGAALPLAGSIEALARYFEYWLLRLEGLYPALDRCPRCGEAALGDVAVLDLADRAYLCGACSTGGPRLSAAALAFLRAAGTRTPADMARTAGSAGSLRELAEVHARLMALHLDKDVRSSRVMKELRPGS
jgi:DNA repair protein RecO (recombination protein O)